MGYRVAVVGATGNVGREMLAILEEVKFPVDEIFAVASRKSIGIEVSFGMALRWSLDRPDLDERLSAAVRVALDNGARTRDLGGSDTTQQMGDAVLKALAAA